VEECNGLLKSCTNIQRLLAQHWTHPAAAQQGQQYCIRHTLRQSQMQHAYAELALVQ
jgi:hypothetical protein